MHNVIGALPSFILHLELLPQPLVIGIVLVSTLAVFQRKSQKVRVKSGLLKNFNKGYNPVKLSWSRKEDARVRYISAH